MVDGGYYSIYYGAKLNPSSFLISITCFVLCCVCDNNTKLPMFQYVSIPKRVSGIKKHFEITTERGEGS